MRPYLFIAFQICCFFGFSQKSSYSSVQLNQLQKDKLLHQAYTQAELDTILANDSVKYKTIVYYYTESFILEKITDCTDCPEFNAASFSVYAYETERRKSERVFISIPKSAYRIVLLAKNEMAYTLPVFLTPSYNNLREQ